MRLSDECANFTLNTLLAPIPQPYNTTFPNINIKTILGDMYDKYNKFALICTSISFGTSNTALDGSNQMTQFKMSGLNCCNAGFNNFTTTSSYATFTVAFIVPKTVSQLNSSTNRVVFNKPSTPILTLNIIGEN